MLRPEVDAKVTAESRWMPRGYGEPHEARLEEFGPAWTPQFAHIWKQLEDWWLAHPKGANTPNWDICLGCEIEGKPGLVLVEAKAHETELNEDGKVPKPADSQKSRENHERITAAIAEACKGLQHPAPGTSISVKDCYQFSNRIAFAWKLATMKIPVALVYLGFLDDSGMTGYFRDDEHWRRIFVAHVGRIFQTPLDRRFRRGAGPVLRAVAVSPSPGGVAVPAGAVARGSGTRRRSPRLNVVSRSQQPPD